MTELSDLDRPGLEEGMSLRRSISVHSKSFLVVQVSKAEQSYWMFCAPQEILFSDNDPEGFFSPICCFASLSPCLFPLTCPVSTPSTRWLYLFKSLSLPNEMNTQSSSPKPVPFVFAMVIALLSWLCCVETLELNFLGRLINFLPDYATSVALEQTLQDCSSWEVCLRLPRLPPCPPWDGASGNMYPLSVLGHCTEQGWSCRMGKALLPI